MNTDPYRPTSFWREVFTRHAEVLTRVLPMVLAFGWIATMIAALQMWADADLAVDAGPFEIAGALLGMLLVLRTNSGYDRWWEARKLWGGVVNQSRSLVQAALAYGPTDPHWRGQVVRWTAAFAFATRSRLRGQQQTLELEDLIGKEEAERAGAAGHVPNYISMRLALLLREARDCRGMDGFGLLAAEAQRATLEDHLGGCERILKTPLASVYSITIRRFLFLYLASAPFALLHKMKSEWLVPPTTAFLACLVLVLDQIGVELQQPFSTHSLSHLPLDDICRHLERDLWALLEEAAVHEGQMTRRDGDGKATARADDAAPLPGGG